MSRKELPESSRSPEQKESEPGQPSTPEKISGSANQPRTPETVEADKSQLITNPPPPPEKKRRRIFHSRDTNTSRALDFESSDDPSDEQEQKDEPTFGDPLIPFPPLHAATQPNQSPIAAFIIAQRRIDEETEKLDARFKITMVTGFVAELTTEFLNRKGSTLTLSPAVITAALNNENTRRYQTNLVFRLLNYFEQIGSPKITFDALKSLKNYIFSQNPVTSESDRLLAFCRLWGKGYEPPAETKKGISEIPVMRTGK